MTELEPFSWAAAATTRQGLYRMFSKALLSPQDGLAETLAAAAEYLEEQDLAAFPFYPQWLAFRSALVATPGPERLATTHVRLFASGVDGALCPPTESWYKTEARFGGTAQLVAALETDYRALGLTIEGSAEPPDHAATELEAMSTLCAREAAAWRAGHDAMAADALGGQERFLGTHLATWFGDFAFRVRDADRDGWYGAVAGAVDAFIVQEVDLVRALRRQLGAA